MEVICAVIGSQMLSDEQHLWVSIYRKAVLISVISQLIVNRVLTVHTNAHSKENCHLCNVLSPGGRLSIKMSFQYRDPLVKDKTVS